MTKKKERKLLLYLSMLHLYILYMELVLYVKLLSDLMYVISFNFIYNSIIKQRTKGRLFGDSKKYCEKKCNVTFWGQ